MYTSATCGNQGFPWLLEMKGSGAQTAEIHNLGPATITHQDGGAHHPSIKRPIKEMISKLKSHFQSHLQHTHMRWMFSPGSHFFAKNLAFSKSPEQQ